MKLSYKKTRPMRWEDKNEAWCSIRISLRSHFEEYFEKKVSDNINFLVWDMVESPVDTIKYDMWLNLKISIAKEVSGELDEWEYTL